MTMELVELRYSNLVDDIRATLSEHIFQSRWALVEGYWKIGKLIRDVGVESPTTLIRGLAVDTQISERTLWYAMKLYDQYPDTAKIPEGKNISWTKLVTKYLPNDAKDMPVSKLHTCTCPNCGNMHIAKKEEV